MFFANLLNSLVKSACVYHEAGERSRLINILSNMHLGGLCPQALPIWAWKRIVFPDIKSCSKSYYIDSNNHLYGLTPSLPQLYPNVHVVHIVRDPRGYVRSHINWSKHRLKSFIANYLTPFWQPNAFLLGEMSLSDWTKASQLERFAWIWNFKNRFIDQIEKTETPYLRVRFEDLFIGRNPSKHFNTILSFIGYPEVGNINERFQRPVNPTKNRSFPHWNSWSPEQCHKLQALCEETMQKYSYGNEANWLAKTKSQ